VLKVEKISAITRLKLKEGSPDSKTGDGIHYHTVHTQHYFTGSLLNTEWRLLVLMQSWRWWVLWRVSRSAASQQPKQKTIFSMENLPII